MQQDEIKIGRNEKEIKSMLEAIIQCSEEAISVVDENGIGLLINQAYTKLTGLKKEEVIGKPATIDISEGDSVHLEVLRTRKPMRNVRMKVGPNKRDVLVNVAPVVVDGVLRGSVGIIHDVSEIQQLTTALNRARQIIRTLEAKYTFDDIAGQSESIKSAIEQAKLAARTPVTVLLRGESGTGKELFAHAIHNDSSRKYNKFIRVNCAAITGTLLESELFGYEDGAFTGAKRGGKRGYFEEANNGSIFLDEIGELPLYTQAKLLRVLQENEIIRVGGNKPISINVRVIAATNSNLEKGVAEGTFREDLYYRLNKIPIIIPPLRHRREDIPIISATLLQKINQDYGRNVEGISHDALNVLMEQHYQGNVRELENILARAIIFMNYTETIMKEQDLQSIITMSGLPVKKVDTNMPLSKLDDELHLFEGKMIEERITYFHGNKTKAAASLGISVRNLYYKLEKYNHAKNDTQ